MKRLLRPVLLYLLWHGVKRKVGFERPRVIAVTGSIGKTSAKEAIATVLETSGFPVVKTHGNLGTDIGVPLSLFGFEELPSRLGWLLVLWRALFPPCLRYEKRPYYVLEYSSDKPGDIAFLTGKLPADVGVVTTVAPVHMQFFPDLKALVVEELAVSHGLNAGGSLIANADDPHQAILRQEHVETIWYGMEGIEIDRSEAGLAFTRGGIRYQTSLIGVHQLYPLLAAIAVGESEGVSSENILRQVAAYQVPAGRGRLLQGKNGLTIIDDTYNSSPKAVKAALLMLKEIAGKRPTIAVIGHMNELGERSEELHREVAAAASSVDRLVLVGPHGEAMRDSAVQAGLPTDRIVVFQTSEECLERFAELVFNDEVILIKASQNGMRLERLVKSLLADPADAKQLVRQSLTWKQV